MPRVQCEEYFTDLVEQKMISDKLQHDGDEPQDNTIDVASRIAAQELVQKTMRVRELAYNIFIR